MSENHADQTDASTSLGGRVGDRPSTDETPRIVDDLSPDERERRAQTERDAVDRDIVELSGRARGGIGLKPAG